MQKKSLYIFWYIMLKKFQKKRKSKNVRKIPEDITGCIPLEILGGILGRIQSKGIPAELLIEYQEAFQMKFLEGNLKKLFEKPLAESINEINGCL